MLDCTKCTSIPKEMTPVSSFNCIYIVNMFMNHSFKDYCGDFSIALNVKSLHNPCKCSNILPISCVLYVPISMYVCLCGICVCVCVGGVVCIVVGGAD